MASSGGASAVPFIDGNTVRRLLSSDICLEAARAAFVAMSDGRARVPLRTFVSLTGEGSFGTMPAASDELRFCAAKLITILPGNRDAGRPTIQGVVVLLDASTGGFKALIDAAALTELRTAAASAVATQFLARNDASSHGIVGTGVQGRAHARAIQAACPAIKRIVLWDPDFEKAKQLAGELGATLDVEVVAAPTLDAPLACDIVTAVTPSSTPIVRGNALQIGVHLNLVGAHEPDKREADGDAVAGARLFVDSLEPALAEAGDLLIAAEEGRISLDQVGEIGDLILGRIPGRSGSDETTLFKSVGTAAQDLYLADRLWRIFETQMSNTKAKSALA